MLIPLQFRPGLNRNLTHYANTGGWYDCDKIRFRQGLPEKIGGWVKQLSTAFLGVCRSMISWTDLSGNQNLGLGTNLKYYIIESGDYIDVTPIRKTVTLGADPFASVITTTTITVTDAGHGCVVNDFVTYSGATGFAGIPSGDLNQEHEITSIIDANSYTIEVATAATATAVGGGAAVDAEYQINVGLATSVIGLGWGAGTWGRGTWGSGATSGTTITLRLWSNDTFGEDLIINVRNGGIYYWDATTPANRAVALSSLAGASDAPTIATQVMVSAEERHVIAFGSNPIGSSVQDPLFVRWSDTESATNWTPAVTNSAGGYRLSIGTSIVSALHTRSETLIWTDLALYSMQWTGPPYTFSFRQVAYGINIIAPHAMVSVNDAVIWMGREEWYFYDGRVQPLKCALCDYVFRRMNYSQTDKIFAFSNSTFDEIGWLYPSTTDECDSYIIYNYKEDCWYYGSLERTAWLDRGNGYYPNATSADGYLYDHEYGFDDGSTNPPSAITAFIESSPLESPNDGQGEHFQMVSRLIPDITFRNSSAASPSVTMTVKMQDYPGGNFSQNYASSVTQSATVPIEQFTQQAFIRLRGRSAAFRCESTTTGVTWRLGVPRIEVRPDGRR